MQGLDRDSSSRLGVLKINEASLVLEPVPFGFEALDAFEGGRMAAEGFDLKAASLPVVLDALELEQHVGHAARINARRQQVLPAGIVGLELVGLGKALAHQELRAVAEHAQHAAAVAQEEPKDEI